MERPGVLAETVKQETVDSVGAAYVPLEDICEDIMFRYESLNAQDRCEVEELRSLLIRLMNHSDFNSQLNAIWGIEWSVGRGGPTRHSEQFVVPLRAYLVQNAFYALALLQVALPERFRANEELPKVQVVLGMLHNYCYNKSTRQKVQETASAIGRKARDQKFSNTFRCDREIHIAFNHYRRMYRQHRKSVLFANEQKLAEIERIRMEMKENEEMTMQLFPVMRQYQEEVSNIPEDTKFDKFLDETWMKLSSEEREKKYGDNMQKLHKELLRERIKEKEIEFLQNKNVQKQLMEFVIAHGSG